MIPWRVTLSGVDITSVVSSVRVSFAAGSICGECDIQLADRAVLAGVVVPRVPRRPSMGVEVLHGGVWETRGMFFLERISRPQDISSRTAAIWGRSVSARLGEPWGPKISRQWDAETSIAAIVAELSALTGATIAVTKDYPVCAYCYAVTEQTPAQILRDLATKSGQELWPQPDGSVRVAPRLYRDLPAPAHTFPAADIVMRRRDRIAPDFGNRVLISGDGAVAGLSVTVVPMYAGEECVAANGKDQVRLLAVVLDREGRFVAPGTQVGWSAPAGTLALASSPTGPAEIVGETQRAQSYTRLSLNLPASAVIGVYAYSDHHRRRNLYLERRGSVDGRVITFAQPLDFFDQAVLVDYEVLGATNIWTAGYEPGDVTVTAAVAGAQGSAVIHQSNPTACSSSIVLESSPDKICIGEKATILAKVKMFAGAGSGMIEFDLRGCGRLSSRRKLLTVTPVTEKLRTTTWGGVSQVRLGEIGRAHV